MIRKFVLAISFTLLFCASAFGQFYPTLYRPPVDWQQLSTEHFQIIFPQGYDSTALKTAHILEAEYPKVQQLTGGSLSNFPVILTNYTDRSNGLVTSLHFRSEIDIPPMRGKALNPQTGGWLANVVPHELVHAMQFSNLGGAGLGQLVNIFSPDLARSIHGASPAGIQEGLATYYESAFVARGGGRGNYPFFSNQFNAVFNSPQRWSMGQMVHIPAYTRPFNRYYIGGYEFTNWLQNNYGWETSRDAIGFHIRWPFLGYGVALRHATGKWPAQLYDEFEEKKEYSLPTKTTYTPLPIDFNGRDIRRPKWLSDSTLIFYGSFYNAKPGFYRYNLSSQKTERLITTESVTDYNYALSKDKQTLIYSYYQEDLIYPNASKVTLVQASLTSEDSNEIKPDCRLFAPSYASDSTIIALESGQKGGKAVKMKLTNQSVHKFLSSDSLQYISVIPHPHVADSLAIVANNDGNQALWLVSKEHISHDMRQAPVIAFREGSVFDPVWHPSGNRLLFSADFSGTLQVYEYNLSTKQITQLTSAAYNAFEASYSPDGNRIAFIIQYQNERLPVILPRNKFHEKTIPENTQTTTINKTKQLVRKKWVKSDYSTGLSWLKPRTLLPELEEISGGDNYQIGIGLHSSDLLQQQAYSLKFTTANERLWYDATYRNKQFFPGFKARIYSEPVENSFRFVTQDKDTLTQSFLRQERSFALSTPMQFSLNQNVYFTSLYIEPEIRQSQLRYFSQQSEAKSGFSNATIGNIFAQLNYRLQQNIRDVQPNSGLVLYTELEHFFTSGKLNLPISNSEASLNFNQPTALRGGVYGYLSPFKRWNQSLRIGIEGLTQTSSVFDNQAIVSNGFSGTVLSRANNLVSFDTRYTIPLAYPDNGGFLIPLYLSNIYLVGFTDTVTDPTAQNIIDASRTVIGGGLRVQFRISNLSFDIGVGVGVEPSRSKMHYFIGNF